MSVAATGPAGRVMIAAAVVTSAPLAQPSNAIRVAAAVQGCFAAPFKKDEALVVGHRVH
ncbi:MAG: hypothetical protein AW07_03256 [Candidatus Accumulibacter sp. SK-11]|nr:MAG: hypothetical protein AW07_03256 [Candidatus Accumulibacter sp. SK-11]